jgi:sortase A
MRKLLTIALAAAMLAGIALPVAAASPQPPNYQFETGDGTLSGFGKTTTYSQTVAPDPDTENLRRNKDAALQPPPFGFFSGDFATDTSAPYHNNLRESYGYADSAEYSTEGVNGEKSSGWVVGPATPQGSSDVGTPDYPVYPGSVANSGSTEPSYNADGSMGSLYVYRSNTTLKVYQGESLDNMKKGIGHFLSTSAWDGNVGFAGHNRGAAGYFGFVKNIQIGDLISYTTPYGTRMYKVYAKNQIDETDWSSLDPTSGNVITLITCVENVPALRWSVQAAEVV